MMKKLSCLAAATLNLGFATGFVAATLLAVVPARAEMIGDYHREAQNIGVVDVDVARIEGLLFALYADRGLQTNDDGVVTAWRSSAGREVVFRPVFGDAAQPVRRIANAVGDRAAVRFATAQHRPGYLRSSEHVAIDPDRGLTLFALARVSDATREWATIFGYGSAWRAPGAMTLGLQRRLQALQISGGRRYDHVFALLSYLGVDPDAGAAADGGSFTAPVADAAGKGFIVMAVRFDPATGEQVLFENGVAVARARRRDMLAPAQQMAVGAEVRGVGSFEGDMLAAVAYNQALEDAQLQAVSQALQLEFGLVGKPVSRMAALLPFAYYPSRNQMEVAIDLGAERIALTGGCPESVTVRVLQAQSGEQVATGTVPLDGQGRGQAIFDVPELPDGVYAVEYVIGAHVERSPKTFRRIHFPFEKTSYGTARKVYPPFEPVRVNGNTVSVVGRRYSVNAQGLFDSVLSLDRELLAAPMRLVAEDADGKALEWKTGWLTDGVKGKAVHEDEAVFTTRSRAGDLRLESRVVVQEDGCARITMILGSDAPDPAPVSRLWLEIPLKDAEVPLFHYVADNAMRFNYAGYTPRLPEQWNGAGRIEWYTEPWDGGVPIRWRAEQTDQADPPSETLVWTPRNIRQHGNLQRNDHRPFAPYIWLGAEERGLAFFMENERGFETDYRTPLQRIVRRGDQVMLRIEIFQSPVRLNTPRTIEFGLMASPGKPMEPSFRARPFASGVGPVSCWGGWQCSSKYPDNRDWSIVDRIQEIRRRGKYTPEDQAWFEAKYEEVKTRWPERKINGSADWLWLTTHFARRAAEWGRTHSGVYFEEHATDTSKPEWQVFQDEWASSEFNRFRSEGAWYGVFAPSYHDFALYMANEWMSRGVSLYYDNTNPKRTYNERFGPAYRTPAGALVYGISLFAQRDYYRRIWKLAQEWNERGVEYPIDFTLHITSTQTLPLNTWATATLDLEQRAHTLNPAEFPAEVAGLGGGFQLPWAAEFTRVLTFGRQVGAIPVALDFVSGHGRHESDRFSQEMMLRNWAMSRIHDVRGARMWPATAARSRRYDEAMAAFGYGNEAAVEHHNYWGEKPLLDIGDPAVKWLALTRREAVPAGEPAAMILLQSYNRTEAVDTTISRLPLPTGVLRDIESGEEIPVTGNAATVRLPAPYGTRMFTLHPTNPPDLSETQP